MVGSVFSVISSFPLVAFSGSRSLPSSSAAALRLAASWVAPSAGVVVGCARGADSLAQSLFPAVRVSVFSVASGRWGSGRSAFARRSAAVVEAAAARGGLWLSFPVGSCPSVVRPSPSASRCFCGAAAGSWSSLALAVGRGVPALVFLPPSCPAPSWLWAVDDGWFCCSVLASRLGVAMPCQLSLF